MLDFVSRLLRRRSPELEGVDLVPKIHEALAKPAVLQVVILKDGLLIGTEVFLAGRYSIGSGSGCDLRLEDSSVGKAHAVLQFQDGKVAVAAQGHRVHVNGFPVTTAELRSIDEVAIGAFSLKMRVLAHPVAPVRSRAARESAPLNAESPTGLFFELFWGEHRQHARAFSGPTKPVVGALDDRAAVPMWGFALPTGAMVLAEKRPIGYRVFVPPGAAVERREGDGDFQPLTAEQLTAIGSRKFIKLREGQAVRFSSGESALIAAVRPVQALKPVYAPAGVSELAFVLIALFVATFALVVTFAPPAEEASFVPRPIPVEVRALFKLPPKKRPAEISEIAPKDSGVRPPPRRMPQPTRLRPPPKIGTLTLGGEALAALIAPGRGAWVAPRRTHWRTGASLVPLPIAPPVVGFGSIGSQTRGAEALKGVGIGELGASVRSLKVIGTVDNPRAREAEVVGSIDRNAVARVIDSHLSEVSGCYERALLAHKDLGGGKILLEWTISTAGLVTSARSRSSTMRSSAVESCILLALKKWRFPAAKGTGVVVSYPFLFNAVDY